MMKIFNFLIFVILATQTLSEQEIIKPILNHQILAGYEALAKDTAKLHEVTKKKCLSSKIEVKKLYNDAYMIACLGERTEDIDWSDINVDYPGAYGILFQNQSPFFSANAP